MVPTILLTFDVEDWFQVENFKDFIPFSSWQNYEMRVEKNVHKILDLLDADSLINPNNKVNQKNQIDQIDQINQINQTNQTNQTNQKNLLCHTACEKPKATFFVLGWVAERLPHLIREIRSRGHEIASHGFSHKLCGNVMVKELKQDLERSKKLLEDITGSPVYGYRAPNFSIDDQVLKCIEEAGYNYDSSYNSYRLNNRYGKVAMFNNHNGCPQKISETFYEFPISNLKIGNFTLHWGGGGYFRLIPINIFISGVKRILKNNGIYMIYLHPWEFDDDQPRMNKISPYLKFRHYFNLNRTFTKFCIFLMAFRERSFLTCSDYLKTITPGPKHT